MNPIIMLLVVSGAFSAGFIVGVIFHAYVHGDEDGDEYLKNLRNIHDPDGEEEE